MQGALLLQDIEILKRSSFCTIVINDLGQVMGCFPKTKEAAEDLMSNAINAAKHIARISNDLLLWVWANESTCLAIK